MRPFFTRNLVFTTVLLSVLFHGATLLGFYLFSFPIKSPVEEVVFIDLSFGSGGGQGGLELASVSSQVQQEQEVVESRTKTAPQKKATNVIKKKIAKKLNNKSVVKLSKLAEIEAAKERSNSSKKSNAGTETGTGPVAKAGIGSGGGQGGGKGTGKGEGQGGTSQNEISRYVNQVVRRIDRSKRYPKLSQQNAEAGVVTVKLTLGRGGELIDYHLVKETVFPRLSQATLATVQAAAPFPPLPSIYTPSKMTIEVPVRFQLAQGR